MTMPPPPANQKGMVRAVVIAIILMTIAIVVILAAMVAKLIAPSDDESVDAAPSEVAAPVATSSVSPGAVSPGGAIDFSAAPEVEIGLPPGARVVAVHVTGDRLTLEIETVQGDSAIYTAPLTGFDGPVRLVYRTLE